MGLFSWLNSSSSPSPDADDIPTKSTCYHVEGFLSCSYFQQAVRVANRLTADHPNVKVEINGHIRPQWPERLQQLQQTFQTQHRTSPFVYQGCSPEQKQSVVGGYTDFARLARDTYHLSVPLD